MANFSNCRACVEVADLSETVIAHRAGTILLVGHEPKLSRLVSLLTTGGGVGVSFKKAELSKLKMERLRAKRCATIEWVLTAKHLSQGVRTAGFVLCNSCEQHFE